jgi:toxin CptA
LSAAPGRHAPALRIELDASRTLACALAGAHVLAAGAVLASVPLQGALLACVGLAASGCWTIGRHALLRSPRALTSLELRAECECRATQRDGRSVQCRILGSSYVSTRLIVLHLREPGRRRVRRIALLRDSIGAEPFRRLRVRLRWCDTGCAKIPELAASDPPL